jgi:phage tail-like protein
MPPVFRADPYAAYNFQVIVTNVSDDGAAVGGAFNEVTGLELERAPIEYRTGADDATPRKMAGLIKYSNLSLKRGITGDPAFWNWIVEALNGNIRRTAGSVILLDENRQEAMRWNFARAWPTKYTGPSLGAGKNEIAMETLVLVVEKLRIA